MTNEELVREYQRTGNRSTLETICRNNAGLIGNVVKRMRWMYPGESATAAAVTESDDLRQYGYIALIRAVEDYDPDKGAAFSTFATAYIKNGIMNEMRDKGGAVRIPAHIQAYLLKLRDLRARLPHPSIQEIAAFIGISTAAARDLLTVEDKTTAASLDGPAGDGLTLADHIQDDKDPIGEALDGMFYDQMRADVWQLVDNLDSDRADVLRRHFLHGEALQDIGRSKGKYLGWANRKAAEAFAELRRNEMIADYADRCHIAINKSYRGSVSRFLHTGTSATEAAALELIEAENRVLNRMSKRDRDNLTKGI